ncbi:DUF5753 domain-containing protein [Actinocorallia longicatena]|uniref:DUF5753 domain-containing protein n=1 Tax=Actinocorallia longicatena TaxID=111803 RepID=A0ABP6PWU0_9ACTN
MSLEETATRIRAFEVQFVPSLLQTADYARAHVRLGDPDISDADLDRKVHERMLRQQRLHSGDLKVWAVVDENALRRPIGGRSVMRAQVEHLLLLTERSNLTLQIIPFNAGGHGGISGAFSILRFPEATLPDIVYLEQLTSALYLHEVRELDRYTQLMDRLCLEAAQPKESVKMLAGILR